MTYTIKPFDKSNDAHYEALVRFDTAMYPEYPSTVEHLKRREAQRPADRHSYQATVFDDSDGEIVAVGGAYHSIDTYHPQKFWLGMSIEPARDVTPLREQLYTHLLDHLAQFDPIQLAMGCNTTQPHISSFLEQRGYEMKVREYSSKLELSNFDPAPFQSYIDRVIGNGIEFLDMHQLEARYPETWTKIVHDVAMEVDQDVPWHEPIKPEPYDSWIKRFSDQPHRVNKCYLVAMDGDEAVALTMIFKSADKLFTGLSGVRRSHRRQGITMAVKVRSLSIAKAMFPNASVMTENEESNPMYTINERLGFMRQPDFLNWVKDLT